MSIAAAIPLIAFAPAAIAAHAEWVIGLTRWLGLPYTRRAGTFGTLEFPVPDVPSFHAAGSLYVLIIGLAGMLAAIALLIRWQRVTPYRVIGALVGFVTGVSGLFFYFAGEQFPYTTRQFAELWMRAEFTLWIVIPMLFAVALAAFPFSLARTFLYTLTAVSYSVWFSVVRLTLLLAVLHFGGMVWFAPAYLFAGFLVDFIYIVALYSLASAAAARAVRRHGELWAW